MNDQPNTELSAAELAHEIGRSHPARVQLNLDILNHVAKYQPCGFRELNDLFGDAPERLVDTERFRSRLASLTYGGQLIATGAASTKRWRMPLQACPEHCVAPLPAYVGVLTPPAQYDRMHGPAYVPPADDSPRAGGLDYKRHASVGFAC